MKAITSIFILILFLAISCRFLLFETYIESHKTKFLGSLSGDGTGKDIIEVTISAGTLYKNNPGIEWMDDNSEVVMDGKFYEVLKVGHKSGKIVLYLLPDTIESELFKSFFSLKGDYDTGILNILDFILNLEYMQDEDSYGFSILCSLNHSETNYLLAPLTQFHAKLRKPPKHPLVHLS